MADSANSEVEDTGLGAPSPAEQNAIDSEAAARLARARWHVAHRESFLRRAVLVVAVIIVIGVIVIAVTEPGDFDGRGTRVRVGAAAISLLVILAGAMYVRFQRIRDLVAKLIHHDEDAVLMQDATFRWVTFGLVLLTVGAAGMLASNPPPDVQSSDWARVKVVTLLGYVLALVGYGLYAAHVKREVNSPDRQRTYGTAHESRWAQMFAECNAMAEHALKSGSLISTPPSGADLAFLDCIEQEYPVERRAECDGDEPVDDMVIKLAGIHARLTRIVAPASPQTLALIATERQRKRAFGWLGTIRLVRMMVGLALFLTPAFIALAISVGTEIDDGGLFAGDFWQKSRTAVYLVVAAGLGATFAALAKAFDYVSTLSYDDRYESSYWIRFVQGIVAGIILSIVISQAFFAGEPPSAADPAGGGDLSGFRISVPLLAFVGGFSSDLVYRVVERVISAIDTLIRGSVDSRTQDQEQQIRGEQRLKELETTQAETLRLAALRAQLPDTAVAARKQLDELIAARVGDALGPTPPDDNARLRAAVLAAVRGVDNATSVNVAVLGGTVVLQGSVADSATRLSVINAARAVSGVSTVIEQTLVIGS